MELSVGQQQRVAVARALIGRPSLIIADEPTSALDRDSQQAFMKLLFDEVSVAGSSLLFVSHDESLAGGFDRRVALDEINTASTTTSAPHSGGTACGGVMSSGTASTAHLGSSSSTSEGGR